jgi:hypothetical protein
MAPTPDSYEFYFKTTKTVSKCIVDTDCPYSVDRGTKMSTACLISHLKNQHKPEYKKFEQAREKIKADKAKILESQPKLAFKRLPPDDAGTQTDEASQSKKSIKKKSIFYAFLEKIFFFA